MEYLSGLWDTIKEKIGGIILTLLIFIIIAIGIYYFFIYKDSYSSVFNLARVKKCPNCGNSVENNFNVCPICKETLKKKCINCGEIVEIGWKFCPYCESSLKKDESK